MITAEEIQTELNPQDSATKFKSAYIAGKVAQAIVDTNATVRSNLPERYRRMHGLIAGLKLSTEATQGQTTFNLPSWLATPVKGYVWINPAGVYQDRKVSESVTFTITGGAVVLETPADEGDIIVGDFYHDGSFAPQILKTLALKIACNMIRHDVPSLVSEMDRQSIENDRIFLREDLKQLRRNEMRLDEWDELDLVGEMETITPGGFGTLIADGW